MAFFNDFTKWSLTDETDSLVLKITEIQAPEKLQQFAVS